MTSAEEKEFRENAERGKGDAKNAGGNPIPGIVQGILTLGFATPPSSKGPTSDSPIARAGYDAGYNSEKDKGKK